MRFWLEVGHYEGHNAVSSMLISNRHFYDVLVTRGYDASFREFAGGHDILRWRDSIADALIATLGTPSHSRDPLPPVVGTAVGLEASPAHARIDDQAYRVAVLDGADAAIALLQSSTKLDPFVDLIYRLYYGGHVDAALPIAEWAAKHFPTEWNAFDTLGEAYARVGDKRHAIAAYERALALAPKDHRDNAKVMLEYLRYVP